MTEAIARQKSQTRFSAVVVRVGAHASEWMDGWQPWWGGGLTGEENFTTGACKVFTLCGGTHFGNAGQRRIQNDDLNEARKCRRDDLRHEHGPRRNLHVVAKLEVGHKGESLAHSNVAKSLEDHQRQRSTWLDVTKDKFRQHVQADLVVGYGLNDADGQ